MVFIQLSLLVLLSIINQCTSNAGDAFGLISKVQTYCEYESITMGSKLADYYNSLDEATHKIDRMHIPFISEHLGFGWDHAAYGRSHPTLGLAPSHSTGEGEVTLLQKKGGWLEDGDVAHSAFASLNNKWIYFYGDATLRQLATTFLLPYHGKEMSNYKDLLHSKCMNQLHRDIPAGDSGAKTVPTSGDSHHAPHHLKAKTCTFPGFGKEGKITYDWKHLPYDDYDKWMFGPEGVWHTGAVAHTTTTSSSTSTSSSNPFKEFPDIMVIQIGHSSCLPSSDPTKTNSELHLEEQVIKDHHSQIDALFGAIKEAVERPTAAGSKTAGRTTVIVSLPGRVNLLNRKAERCVWQFNRIIAQAAHKKGFVVFEREEIEHRIGFKVESSEDLRDISVLDAAEAPTSHIVATALLSMISCLARDGVSSAATLAGAQ